MIRLKPTNNDILSRLLIFIVRNQGNIYIFDFAKFLCGDNQFFVSMKYRDRVLIFKGDWIGATVFCAMHRNL